MSTHDWPDPDEVTRALADTWDSEGCSRATVRAAARAYLQMREEHANCACQKFGLCAYHGRLMVTRHHPAEPALTIKQVIAACNAARTDDAPAASEWHIYLSREEGSYRCHIEEFDRRHAEWRCIVDQSKGDTPEAAIQQLGQEAIAKLRERHAADAAKLKELGVEP